MAIQPWTWDSGDEELGAVGVWTGVCHRKLTRLGVLDVEVLVFELVAVDGLTAVAVEVGDVTTLDHEAWNDSVENGVLVAKALFTSAQCSEVLSSLWNLLFEQVEHHSWLLGTANGDVEVDLGKLGRGGGELSLCNVEHLCFFACLVCQTDAAKRTRQQLALE